MTLSATSDNTRSIQLCPFRVTRVTIKLISVIRWLILNVDNFVIYYGTGEPIYRPAYVKVCV